MKNSFKVTSLSVAAISALILTGINNHATVHADDLSNNTAVQNNNAVKQTVSDNDIQNAKNDVDNDQQAVRTAQNNVDQAQANADAADTDYQDYQGEKPTYTKKNQISDQDVTNAEEKVNDAVADQSDARDAVNQAQTNVNNQQEVVDQAQSVVATKQTAQAKAQAASDKANQAVSDMQQKINNDVASENHIVASDNYVNDTKKFNDEYVNSEKQALADGKISDAYTSDKGMDNPKFAETMSKDSDESFAMNQYKHNDGEKNIIVDIDNVTPEQSQELAKYALDLINGVRAQVGGKTLTLNQDAMNFAQDIATQYIKDGREISDGKGHDTTGINSLTAKYGFAATSSSVQFYEDMATIYTNATQNEKAKTSSETYEYITSTDINHKIDMDTLKEGIYYDLKEMLFAHDEWNHAYGLLGMAQYNYNDLFPDNTVKFGFSMSMLPNSNTISTHFILIPQSLNVKKQYANDDTDMTVATPAEKDKSELVSLQKAAEQANSVTDNATQELADAQSKFDVQNTELIRLSNVLRDNQDKLIAANEALNDAQTKLDNAKAAVKQNKEDYAAYQQAVQKYNDELTDKKQKADDAHHALDDAKLALQNAQRKLSNSENTLAKLQAIQKAQQTAEAAENQHNHENVADSTTSDKSQDQNDHKSDTNATPDGNTQKPSDHKADTKPTTGNKQEDPADHNADVDPTTDDNKQDHVDHKTDTGSTVGGNTQNSSDHKATTNDNKQQDQNDHKDNTGSTTTSDNKQDQTDHKTDTDATVDENTDSPVTDGNNDEDNKENTINTIPSFDATADDNDYDVSVNEPAAINTTSVASNQDANTASPVVKPIELTHNAYVYDLNGVAIEENGAKVKLFAGIKINALNNGRIVIINGKQYYQIGENKFVKVVNTISSNKVVKIKLIHNAFVYVKKHGKVVKKRLLRKGKVLNALRKGKTVIIKGKQYYQIGKNEYVKVVNASLK